MAFRADDWFDKITSSTILPSLFINMAVPVIFFHLDLAFGGGFTHPPVGGASPPWGCELLATPLVEGVAVAGEGEVSPLPATVGSATGTAKYN